jgi:hypothetical protein
MVGHPDRSPAAADLEPINTRSAAPALAATRADVFTNADETI